MTILLLLKKLLFPPINMAIRPPSQARNPELFLTPLSILSHRPIYPQVPMIQLPKDIRKSPTCNTLVRAIIMDLLDYCNSFSVPSGLAPLSPFSHSPSFSAQNFLIDSNCPSNKRYHSVIIYKFTCLCFVCFSELSSYYSSSLLLYFCF